tara:strand:+ start:1459 stop:2238 length:780 start_codon:yes stop_codon:yes gene_type:complete
MDRRCLFVEAEQLVGVRLDGPALRLRAPRRSWQWFPLRRISRVLCVGVPGASFEVWARVAQHGVPVLFVQKNGRVISQLCFPGAESASFQHWMSATFADAELSQAYQNWLENFTRHSYGLMGAVSCDVAHAASKAELALLKLAKQRRLSLTQEMRQWAETLVANQLVQQAMEFGLPASGSCTGRLLADLKPVASLLTLVLYLSASTAEKGRLSGAALGLEIEHLVELELRAWLQRGFYSLRDSLERAALYQAQLPSLVG